MTMITPSYLGETIEYSSLHACRSTLEDPTIWTESSYKYRRANVQTLLVRAGFAVLDQWVADGFALTLACAT